MKGGKEYPCKQGKIEKQKREKVLYVNGSWCTVWRECDSITINNQQSTVPTRILLMNPPFSFVSKYTIGST